MKKRTTAYRITVEIPGAKSKALQRVLTCYNGSDAEDTIRLYRDLESHGGLGTIAVNLLRAQKNSARAKVYRGGNAHGRYASQAYERKDWSIGKVCEALLEHAAGNRILWGWQRDREAEFHAEVLYVDLPGLGQASFHTRERGDGPEFTGKWDGIRGKSAERIIRFAASVLGDKASALEYACAVCRMPSGDFCITRGVNDDGTLRAFWFCSQPHVDQWKAEHPFPEPARCGTQ